MKQAGLLTLALLTSVLIAPALSASTRSSFVTVKNHKFYVDDKPYYLHRCQLLVWHPLGS